MSKNTYAKVFGSGKNKSYKDCKKSNKKNKDIFGLDVKKKKKKRKKSKSEKQINGIFSDMKKESKKKSLADLIGVSCIKDHGLETLKDLSDNLRGTFIVKFKLDEGRSAFIGIFVGNDGKIYESTTAQDVVTMLIHVMLGSIPGEGELSETDICVAEDKLINSSIVEEIYDVDTVSLIEAIKVLNE